MHERMVAILNEVEEQRSKEIEDQCKEQCGREQVRHLVNKMPSVTPGVSYHSTTRPHSTPIVKQPCASTYMRCATIMWCGVLYRAVSHHTKMQGKKIQSRDRIRFPKADVSLFFSVKNYGKERALDLGPGETFARVSC